MGDERRIAVTLGWHDEVLQELRRIRQGVEKTARLVEGIKDLAEGGPTKPAPIGVSWSLGNAIIGDPPDDGTWSLWACGHRHSGRTEAAKCLEGQHRNTMAQEA